jgi:hypothetical protein
MLILALKLLDDHASGIGSQHRGFNLTTISTCTGLAGPRYHFHHVADLRIRILPESLQNVVEGGP